MTRPLVTTLPPGLYIVATPLGNLGDITGRAIEVLRGVNAVAVEDTRVTGKLLHLLGLKQRMVRYDDHADERTRDALVARLATEAIALVSDAGTPLISDPGYKLVRAAREAGHAVHTVPGPSAVIAALTLAGLPTDRFLFMGFLPSKAAARAATLAEVATVRATLVFFETAPRLAASLAAMVEQLGDRDAAVTRELTKLHEESVNGRLTELAARYAETETKGEIVVVVGPPLLPAAPTDHDVEALLRDALTRLPTTKAAAEVAALTKRDRRELYALAITL